MSLSSSVGEWSPLMTSRWRSSSELRLSTNLSPDELLDRLHRASLRPAFFRMTGPAHSVVGRFQARRFSLIAAQAIRHNQARYFFGEVVQADGRTVVQGRLQRRLPVRNAGAGDFSNGIPGGPSNPNRSACAQPLLVGRLLIGA